MMMVQKLKSISKMKLKKFLILASIIPLTSCSRGFFKKDFYAFDTFNSINLYGGEEKDLTNLSSMMMALDELSDNFNARSVNNVYTINQTNDDVQIDSRLYDLLKIGDSLTKQLDYFNIYCGGLSKLWKNAINNQQIPDKSAIDDELNKLQNTYLEFKDNNTVRRVGEGEIDLGAIVKGYALDECYSYLNEKEIKDFYLSLGGSSNIIGEKSYYGKDFNVGIKNTHFYFLANSCYISTSGIQEQHFDYEGKTYSHIVNPLTGDSICNYDIALVITKYGYLSDALSTAFMMMSADEIKEAETKYEAKAIIIKDQKVVYSNPSIEVLE